MTTLRGLLGVLCVGGAVAGCGHVGLPSRAAPPFSPAEGVALVWPAVEMPLASAPKSVIEDVKEPRGFGGFVGYAYVPFTEFSTMASRGALAGVTPAKGYWTYANLWEPGMGVSVNIITARPIATSVSSGDTYGILCFDYVTFTGMQVSGTSYADDMTWLSLWVEAKAMLNAPRKRPSYALKPYVRYGVGVAMTPDVNVGATAMYIRSVVPGIRASVGIETRRERLGLFVDLGAQITGAPDKATTSAPEVGDAEPAFCMPVRVGIMF
jgi:hypothetical protein